jgi:hypothetical protein
MRGKEVFTEELPASCALSLAAILDEPHMWQSSRQPRQLVAILSMLSKRTQRRGASLPLRLCCVMAASN